MKVKILHTSTGQFINALIKDGSLYSLPKPQYGWKFDFEKFSVGANNFVYVLCREDQVSTIEGCLIFKLINNNEPIMAYVEVAPHNKGRNGKYKRILFILLKKSDENEEKCGFFHKSMTKRLFFEIFIQKDGIYYFSSLRLLKMESIK
jgi:hypothetical protein